MENMLDLIAKMFPQFAASLSAGIIVFARMIGFIRVAPIFNRKEIPGLVKIALAFLLTITITCVVKPPNPDPDNSMILSIVLNFAVGAMIGFMAQLILLAIEAGADMINMQMGLSSAMVLDPTSGTQVSILGKCFTFLAIIVFMEMGGAYWLFNAFMRSFELFPIYSNNIPLDKIVNMDYLIQMTSNVLYMGLQIASPILLATLGQDIILGVISKTAPQVNVFTLSFLFKPLLGSAIMVWILPMLMNIITQYFLSFSHII